MKLEAGKHYRTRGGIVVGPIQGGPNEDTPDRLFRAPKGITVDGYTPMWESDGRCAFFLVSPNPSKYDLVEEVSCG